MLRFHTYSDFAELSEALAQDWLRLLKNKKDGCSFALAGGTTPAPVYQRLDALLTEHKHAPFKLVATDERWVADSDAQSNEGLFRRCFSHSLQDNLVSLKTAASEPTAALSEISGRLQQEFPTAFTSVLLGMGTDGHVASIFPNAPEHMVEDFAVSCLAAKHPDSGQDRISLSLARLLHTEHIWLVITGAEKKRVLEQADSSQIRSLLPIRALLKNARCEVEVFWCPA